MVEARAAESYEFVIDPATFRPTPCPGCSKRFASGVSDAQMHNQDTCIAFQRGYQAGYDMAKLDAARAFGIQRSLFELVHYDD